MKVSVFTPFYRAGVPFIGAAHESLCAQTHTDWEWIILRNGQGAGLPQAVLDDRRVKVIKAQHINSLNGFVGALKSEACGHCTGDVLLELDHDDLLHPEALRMAADQIEYNHCDFVYSDFAEFHDKTWAPHVYQGGGWEWYKTEFQGHDLCAMKAPTGLHAFRRLVWAPNHLRAWRRAFYELLPGLSYADKPEPFTGGHDASLRYADDLDLVQRTLLRGGKIVRIPECLYFYRVHASNNVKTNNVLIQQLDAKVYDRHIYKLAEKFADDSGLRKLDLCGGHDSPPVYTPIDMVDSGPGSLVADLNGPWPLETSSVGVIRAHDALEHLCDPIHTMNEAYRVLAPGGFLLTLTPSTDGPGAWCDPTHVSFWNRYSWRYYTDRNFAKYIPAFKGKFQLIDASTSGGPIPYERAGLVAIKPGYEPRGPVLI